MADVRDLLQEALARFEPAADERAVEHRLARRHRRRRLAAAVVGLGLFAALAAVGWTLLEPLPGSNVTTPSAGVLPSGPTVSPPSVEVGELPRAGVAVGTEDGVRLVALDGTILAMLPGYSLAGNPGAPGVWLRRGDRVYSLAVTAGSLVPRSAEVAQAIDREPGAPGLAPPPDPAGGVLSGHWRYAIGGPSGNVLAQWSGECEIPTAYWIDVVGRFRTVTGEEDPADAPESIALGWTPRGEALVLLPSGGCGRAAVEPGIYRYVAPGVGRLIHDAPGVGVTADAWGTGP